ncbi:CpsB/CapC family capsule biosynthesis tyrosine phosphatase [Faecalimonas sp.]
MKGIVDVHCHILPEIDDGAKNWGEAYQMLRMAYDEGIRVIVATPHHHEHRGMCTPLQYKKRLTTLRKMAQEIDEKFLIMPGMEIYFNQDVVHKLEHKKVHTMGKSKYVLIEFSPNAEFHYIQQGLQQIQMKGYLPILAHIERYRCLLDSEEYVSYLMDMGIYVQVNAGSIIGKSGRTVKKFVKNLLEEQYVHFVGTDAHSSGRRSPMIQKSAEYVQKKFGEDYAKEIFHSNGIKMLKNILI